VQQRLDRNQRRCVEQVARQKETTCDTCGSTDLSSGSMALGTLGALNVEVLLSCNNERAHPEGATQTLELSGNEARRCGIDIS
jgi:hypothetical protein